MGWFLSKANFLTHQKFVKELMRFPELRVVDRFDILVPILTCIGLFYLGQHLGTKHPQLLTNGWQLVIWGFVLSTVLLYHTTFLVNSVAHIWGKRRYKTKDSSKNNMFIAFLTFGEGWHNNHHHFPGSANQGFYWWEIDITYYILKIMSFFGLIWAHIAREASGASATTELYESTGANSSAGFWTNLYEPYQRSNIIRIRHGCKS